MLRMRRAPRTIRVTAGIRFGRLRLSALRRGSARLLPLAQLRAALTGILQQLAPLQTPFTSELLAPRSLCRRGRVRSRPGAVCETARRRRSSLHQPDRLAKRPLVSELEPYNQV